MKTLVLTILLALVITTSCCNAQGSTLWGMTTNGGTNDSGTIFNYTISADSATVQHSFSGGLSDGALPSGSLIRATNDLLYGLTSKGGVYDDGVIFSYNIADSKDSVVYSFKNSEGEYLCKKSIV